MRKGNHFLNRAAGLLCSAAMMSTSLIFPVAAQENADPVADEILASNGNHEGVITNLVMKNFSAIALEYVERTVLYGLGEGAKADDQSIAKVCKAAKRLLGSSQGYTMGKILDACDDILEAVEDLQNQLTETRVELDNSIQKLTNLTLQNTIDNDRATLRSFSDRYSQILNTFASLSEEVKNVEEKTESGTLSQNDLDRLADAQREVDEFYQASSDTQNSNVTFNFYDDLAAVMQTLSPYSFSQPLTDDLNDPELWGGKSLQATWMDHIFDLGENVSPFKHQVKSLLIAGANEAVVPLSVYLNAYRIYTEFGVSNILDDTSLSESQKNDEIRTMWNRFYTAQNRIVRGINQMLAQRPELTTYPNAELVDQTIMMDYHGSGNHPHYQTLGVWDDDWYMLAEYSKDYIYAAVVQPVGSDQIYAIEKNGSPMGGKMSRLNDVWDIAIEKSYNWTQDFYNLMQTKDKDKGFHVITSASQLSGLIQAPAYLASDMHLGPYLHDQGGIDLYSGVIKNIKNDSTKDDDKRDGPMILENRPSYSGASADNKFVNIGMTLQRGSETKHEVSMSGGDTNRSDDPFMCVYTGDSNLARRVYLIDGMDEEKLNLKINGEDASFATYYPVNTPAQVEISLNENEKLVGLNIYCYVNSNDLKVKEWQLRKEIIAQDDVNKFLEPDPDGKVRWNFAMPDSDIAIEAIFEENGAPAIIELQDAPNGDLEFEARNGLSQIEVDPESEQIVTIRPFTGYIVDTIRVESEDGELEYQVLDDTPITPNEVAISFSAPSGTTKVYATYKQTPTVSLEATTNGHIQRNLNIEEKDWLNVETSASVGERVYIDAVADANYDCSNIQIIGKNSSKHYDTRPEANGVSFVMPDESVIAKGEFKPLSSGIRVKILDNDGEDQKLRFGLVNGIRPSLNSAVYRIGQQVTIEVLDPQETPPSTVRAATYSGDKIETKVDGNAVTFDAPAENVYISLPGMFTATESDSEAAKGLIRFIDEEGNPVEESAYSFKEGHRVQIEAIHPDVISAADIHVETESGNAIETSVEGNILSFVGPAENVVISLPTLYTATLSVNEAAPSLSFVNAAGERVDGINIRYTEGDQIVVETLDPDQAPAADILVVSESGNGIETKVDGNRISFIAPAENVEIKNALRYAVHLRENKDGDNKLCFVLPNGETKAVSEWTFKEGDTVTISSLDPSILDVRDLYAYSTSDNKYRVVEYGKNSVSFTAPADKVEVEKAYEQQPFHIEDVDTFRRAATLMNQRSLLFILDTNLDFTGVLDIRVKELNGTLDGHSHTIRNVTVPGGELFETVNGTLYNINFLDVITLRDNHEKAGLVVHRLNGKASSIIYSGRIANPVNINDPFAAYVLQDGQSHTDLLVNLGVTAIAIAGGDIGDPEDPITPEKPIVWNWAYVRSEIEDFNQRFAEKMEEKQQEAGKPTSIHDLNHRVWKSLVEVTKEKYRRKE